MREIVEIARKVFVRHWQLAGLVQAEERRVRLDRQLVERKMFGGLRDRPLQFGRPGIRRLLRPRVNQVKRVALKNRAGDRHRIERLLRACAGGRAPSAPRRRATCTPSETRLTPAVRKPRKRVASTLVGLASSVTSTSGATLQCLADAIENRLHRRRLHQRRRAAAEKNARHGAAGTRAAVAAISVS